MLEANDFWTYSCDLYAKNKIAKRCLSLQDNHNCNVNLFLFCLYLFSLGKTLSTGQCLALSEAIESLEKQLKQHRAMRKTAKSASPKDYERLKEEELKLEQKQQALLVNTFNDFDSKAENDPITSFVTYYDLDQETANDLVLPVKASS